MQKKFSSKFGFLISAVGGAVGLGNIWMFPYKLQKYGGMFLYIYLLLTFSVGIVLLTLEFILGKCFKSDVIKLYKVNAPKFKNIGIFTSVAPLIILMYYCAAGGVCLKYLFKNLLALISINRDFSDIEFDVISTLIFILLMYCVAVGGVNKGIERFNKITVPILMITVTIWAVCVICVSDSALLLNKMFVLNRCNNIVGFFEIFSISAEQMFFSLSIAVGSMITYGALMPNEQNVLKSSVAVVFADTFFAVMMSVVIISCSSDSSLISNGPELIFSTMQSFFDNKGYAGNILGMFFYLSVLIAALTSAVSYIEVPTIAIENFSTFKRRKALLICVCFIFLPSVFICLENFGNFYKSLILICEGILVPLTALLSSLNFGLLDGFRIIQGFIDKEINYGFVKKAFVFMLKYIVECVIITVIFAQLVVFL